MRGLSIRTVAAALAGVSLIGLVTPFVAEAQAQDATRRDFNIPAGDMAGALETFGRQSGRDIMFDRGQVAGRRSSAVRGSLEPSEALRRLVSGSGLSVTAPNAVTFVVGRESGEAEAGGAAADSGSAGEQEIVVTGTNLRNANPVGSPVRTIGRSEIGRSGFLTTEQVIQSLPQNFRGSGFASPDANFSPRFSDRNYGAGVNLRGLGNSGVLILVNGHRTAASGNGYFTDISSIPLSAIERIDVLADGASAIYGSDAIAGVVNVILRRGSEGFEAGARYGQTTQDGYSTLGGYVQAGHEWSGGGFTIGGDWGRQTALSSSERSFTATAPDPTDIFPAYDQFSVNIAGHQVLTDGLELHGDAQFTGTDRTAFFANRFSQASQTFRERINRWNASSGLSYELTDSLSVSYDIVIGGELRNSLFRRVTTPVATLSNIRTSRQFTDHNIVARGSIFQLPAGAIRFAVGAAYRDEQFSQTAIQAIGNLTFNVERDVSALYGELQVPIFGDEFRAPGLHELTLSAALRYDDYSDVGHTLNPRLGIAWSPFDSLQVRGTYSTSFRAPALGTEAIDSLRGITGALVQPTAGPGGTTQVPLLVLLGGQPDLVPEEAENLTVGIDFTPRSVPNLRLSLTYYDISFTGQLASPPNSTNPLNDPTLSPVVSQISGTEARSLVNNAVANGALFLDITGGLFGTDPFAQGVYVFDSRTANLSRTDTSGFDGSISYHFTTGPNRFDARLDVTYISKFASALTSAAPTIDRVNTVGFPASTRARGQLAWTRGGLNAALAGNFVGDYRDTTSQTGRRVRSHLTWDLSAQFRFPNNAGMLRETTLAIAVTNLFDRNPPFVTSAAAAYTAINYDGANANPQGRFISARLSKRW